MKNNTQKNLIDSPKEFYNKKSTPLQDIELPSNSGKVRVLVKREDLLRNAPQVEKGQFRVPPVLE